MRKGRTQPPRSAESYSERTLKSEGDLLDFLQALDEDEGIRVQGNLKNHTGGGFIFVVTTEAVTASTSVTKFGFQSCENT